MGCEDVVFSMSTVRRPEMTRPHSMVTKNFGEAEMNLCMFTPDENYTEVVTQLQQGPARHSRIALKGGEFPSFNSLCGPQLLIRSRSPSRRSRSVDFLEYALPSEDTPQLGCKITGGKPFWRNLRFWQRHKKKGVACYTVAPSPQHPDFRSASRRHKAKRLAGCRTAHREVLGPIYSDGSSIVPGQMSKQQIPCPIIIAPLPSKSDGKLCPYMPLNRSQRIPSGPLYLP